MLDATLKARVTLRTTLLCSALSSSDDSGDSFDPFESFDAHDRAAGRDPQHESASSKYPQRFSVRRSSQEQAQVQPQSQDSTRYSRSKPTHSRAASSSVSLSDSFDTSDPFQPKESAESSETTYTRSRRTPGEARLDEDEAKKSQRPKRSLKGRALGYLSRREYSRAELARKLKSFVEETDSLDTVLDSLEAENWLSDSRFAESLIHRRASRLGVSRIVGELKQHSLDQALVEEASAQLRETGLARAQAVWRKKFGELPQTPADRAKQARFLASRGFSAATIGKILKGIDEEWLGE
ncbi:MAG: Regulatory protein RecX [uncultured Paraburkholderia sp.]|nr:MAG: Regulatory protein RecX [uncultured Paraburkholderia sp.]CAH2935293.1 MAG: Regulatory protein RecX [uncultured Paraburkholderia sp.]